MINNIVRLPLTRIICKGGVTLKTLSESMFDTHMQAISQAEVTFVLAGTNDIDTCSVSDLIGIVQSIWQKYHDKFPGPGHIGFGTIIPRPRDSKFMAAKVKNYNKELMAWCLDHGCVCLRMHSPFLQGGKPRRPLFSQGMLHLRVHGAFPSGVYIIDNFLQSEVSDKTLLSRIQEAEYHYYGHGVF